MPASPIRSASATGTRHRSFNLDWSFFHDADKAVKASYAGTQLGRRRARPQGRPGHRTARRARPAGPGATAGELSRLPRSISPLRDLRGAELGRLRPARSPHEDDAADQDGRGGSAPPPRGARAREHRRGHRAGFSGGRLHPPRTRGVGGRRRLPRLPGLAALSRRVRRRDQRRLGERGPGVDRGRRRRHSVRPRAGASCTPVCTSATSGI